MLSLSGFAGAVDAPVKGGPRVKTAAFWLRQKPVVFAAVRQGLFCRRLITRASPKAFMQKAIVIHSRSVQRTEINVRHIGVFIF